MDLFSINTNMGVSRQHNGNAWDFIQCAVMVTRVKSVMHLGAYYFWMCWEHQPRIDESFQPFLDPEIKDSTVDIGNVDHCKSDLGLWDKKHICRNDVASYLLDDSTGSAFQNNYCEPTKMITCPLNINAVGLVVTRKKGLYIFFFFL
jgi:hypothetical protein